MHPNIYAVERNNHLITYAPHTLTSKVGLSLVMGMTYKETVFQGAMARCEYPPIFKKSIREFIVSAQSQQKHLSLKLYLAGGCGYGINPSKLTINNKIISIRDFTLNQLKEAGLIKSLKEDHMCRLPICPEKHLASLTLDLSTGEAIFGKSSTRNYKIQERHIKA